MMCLLHQKKLVLAFLFLFIVLGSYLLHSHVRIPRSPKDHVIIHSSPSTNSVTEHVRRTSKSPEERPKPTKPITKPAVPAKTTKVDFLGDKNTSDSHMPRMRCPRSIQERIVNSSFSNKFQAKVPVLQSAKHFSKDEYKRLQHYYGAYGWGSVSFDVLQKSLAVLNTSTNWQMFDDWNPRKNGSRCIRCAVIGNGGILNGSKKGKEIDKHDYVFRTNGAIFKGFEEDVGTRTSFYTFSTNTLRNSMRTYSALGFKGPPKSKETRYIFLPDHDRDYILMRAAATHTLVESGAENGVEPKHYFGEDVTAEKLKMYHPDFIRYLRDSFLRSRTLDTKYKDIYRPSTGAVMLLAALHTCDEVSAYGFMTENYQKYSDHYYDKNLQQVHFYANHDLKMELNLWQQLHKDGLIKLYMRK